MEKKVFIYPEKILREKATDILNIDSNIKKLAEDMLDTMYKAPGIGLASNQIGIPLRIVVIDIGHDDERGKNPFVLINPVVVEREGEIEWEEGCLSVPDMNAVVKRSNRVIVKAYDLNEHEVSIEGEELLAVVLQHEIDHLDGILYFDHLSKIKKKFFIKKYKKFVESEINTDLAKKIKVK